MTDPKISVIMSVYNGDRWLNDSIKSVLHQTFTDFEFIIINDGSTDESDKIISSYAIYDERIKYFVRPNSGLVEALNFGLKNARGEWIARLDADDLCAKNRLYTQYKFTLENPELYLIGSAGLYFNELSGARRIYRYPKSHKELSNNFLNSRPIFPHSSAFYRRQVVLNLGGYRKRIANAQDLDLWLRIMDVGGIACIDRPLVSIRLHEDQLSSEAGGKTCLEDAVTAQVSFLIKKRGHKDPVLYADDEYNYFRKWISRSIEGEGVLSTINMARKLRIEIFNNNSSIAQKLYSIYRLLQGPGSLIKAVWWRLFGIKLASRLAYIWTERDLEMDESD